MNQHTWTHGNRYRLERCQACGATRKRRLGEDE